ncbi:hypothetical protein CWE15_07285 [Aliidiomarina taiwanensis]|uniref:2-amino-4-hydroxy-6-hydroxymethyldihydropteridine pyrophosphokinase n=1 Tax=Aliidiomarina taiwanensis TaxID=946228 RepID=A0A432X269_9GAMM|nr:2-amino-4-hydroxy-6-hydroxymethyldihydropteridine diphosphokinase [Aliidiomarina taiwanensis]RUO40548.1 hypothetical protein CWE15_07285 [Aliidiomarina taiwanensis]
MAWYYLSLGSNVEPERHLGQTLRTLSQEFGPLLVLPVVQTEPCNMDSPHAFLNTLVILQSGLDWQPLKQYFNRLEEKAGRDRSDPERAHKDRPLDIDIMAHSTQLSLAPFHASTEPYCLASVQALQENTSKAPCVGLRVGSKTLSGHSAATVHTHYSSGHVFIVEDTINTLLQRFEAAFSS